MSQRNDTLRQRLRQHLDNIEQVNEGKNWLRDHCWRGHRPQHCLGGYRSPQGDRLLSPARFP